MNIVKPLKFIPIILIVAFGAYACGGGSVGGASTSSFIDNQPASAELLGPDIDGDGIRDDVQVMIESEYGSIPDIMETFKRMAVIDRKALEVAHDPELLREVATEYDILLFCWFRLFDSYPEGMSAIRRYRSILRDTAERIDRGLLMDGRLNELTSDFGVPELSECP